MNEYVAAPRHHHLRRALKGERGSEEAPSSVRKEICSIAIALKSLYSGRKKDFLVFLLLLTLSCGDRMIMIIIIIIIIMKFTTGLN